MKPGDKVVVVKVEPWMKQYLVYEGQLWRVKRTGVLGRDILEVENSGRSIFYFSYHHVLPKQLYEFNKKLREEIED